MKWQDKLTKSELKHLRESGVTTLKGARVNAEWQANLRNKDPDPVVEPCWQCKLINTKLGFPV